MCVCVWWWFLIFEIINLPDKTICTSTLFPSKKCISFTIYSGHLLIWRSVVRFLALLVCMPKYPWLWVSLDSRIKRNSEFLLMRECMWLLDRKDLDMYVNTCCIKVLCVLKYKSIIQEPVHLPFARACHGHFYHLGKNPWTVLLDFIMVFFKPEGLFLLLKLIFI